MRDLNYISLRERKASKLTIRIVILRREPVAESESPGVATDAILKCRSARIGWVLSEEIREVIAFGRGIVIY
jgi:hypothetical protein